MSYERALEQLYARGAELAPAGGSVRRKFDLEHMRVLAAALGDPQTRFRSVLIAGTNGKGSTAATLASILATSGYRVGLYTSPHLLRVNERIQTSRRSPGENTLSEITDDAFAGLYFKVDDTANRLVSEGRLPHAPSFFEVMTAIGFLAFAEAEVDVAVLEVGLGGRLDATNIVEPMFSVITDISLDHTEWLGHTLPEIAREKAGILRPSGTLVTLPQHPEVNSALGEVAVSLGVTGVNAAEYLPGREVREGSYPIRVGADTIRVTPVLAGEHQHRNLALTIASSVQLHYQQGFTLVTPQSIELGIRQTSWPGRLERSHWNGRVLLMDVAHNPAGVWTLRSYLSRAFEDGTLPGPRTLIFSVLADKALGEMTQILFPLFEEPGDRILLAPMHGPRATSADALAEAARTAGVEAETCASVEDAMEKCAAQAGGSVIVSGSVHLIGEAKTWLATHAAEARG